MAGFLENLLRQGTDAGLGFKQGQRAGQEKQKQDAVEAQKRALEMALLQAQISRTGRQDVAQAANPLDDEKTRAEIERIKFQSQAQPNEFDNLERIPAEVRAAMPGMSPTGRSQVLRQYGYLDQEPEGPRPRGAVTQGAQGLARNFANMAVKGEVDESLARDRLLQSIKGEFPELAHWEAVGVVDAAFKAARQGSGQPAGTILDLPPEEEAWKGDERAVAKIAEIAGLVSEGKMSEEEGERQIADVKKTALELIGG